jgi:hypothetical protein
MSKIRILIGLAVSLTALLFAQTQPAGTLTGKLTDESGAAVANATVTATNIDSGQTRTATTAADGGYQFTLLPPGNYRVKFEAAGFKPLEMPSATVGATPALVDGKLEPGQGRLLWAIWDLRRSSRRAARRIRRGSTSARTCSRFINAWD